MTTKEWLNRGFDTWKRLQIKKAHLETLDNVVSRYDAREIEVYHAENVSETTFIKWSETKKEVEDMERELTKIDTETKDALHLLSNPNEFAVLYCRYIMRKPWADVAKICRYSPRSVYRFHADGVDHLGTLIYSKLC